MGSHGSWKEALDAVKTESDRQKKDGFWEGMDAEHLYQVFAPAEDRKAETPLLADYDRLFGRDFVNCQRDIKPYLPAWAKGLSFATDELRHSVSSVSGTSSSRIKSAPGSSPALSICGIMWTWFTSNRYLPMPHSSVLNPGVTRRASFRTLTTSKITPSESTA
jgi:hypothetical protein